MTAGVIRQAAENMADAQNTTTARGDLARRPREDRLNACHTTIPRYLGVTTADQAASVEVGQ